MELNTELDMLVGRVVELSEIVKDLTTREAITSIAYSHYEQSTNFSTLREMAHAIEKHIKQSKDD